jgi:hypothetical protein
MVQHEGKRGNLIGLAIVRLNMAPQLDVGAAHTGTFGPSGGKGKYSEAEHAN